MTASFPSRLRLWLCWALLAAATTGELFVAHHRLFADDVTRMVELKEILHQHRIPSGRYSMVGPLFASPLVRLDDALQSGDRAVLRFNSIVLAVGILALLVLTRRVLDPTHAAVFAVLVTFASMFSQHLIFFYGEVFSSVTIGLGLLFVVVGWPVLGWTMAVLGVVNTPALLVGFAFVCASVALDRRRLRALAPLIIAAALILLESWIRRGGPFNSGYENDGAGRPGLMPYTGLPNFSVPLFFGVAALLFSFGRGLAFYAPGLWLTLAPKHEPLEALQPWRRATKLWLWMLLGMLLVYGRWWAWHGAEFWGPRFFLFAAFPSSALLLEAIERPRGLGPNVIAFILAVASFWVGIDGIIYRYGDQPQRICNAAEGALCLYAPEASPLWVPFVFGKDLDAQMWPMVALAAAAFVVVVAPLARALSLQLLTAVRAAPRLFSGWRV